MHDTIPRYSGNSTKERNWSHSFTASQWRATILTFRSRYRQCVASEKNIQYLLAISADIFRAVSKSTGSSRKVLDSMDIYNALVDGKRVLSGQGFEIASRSTSKAWPMLSCGSQDNNMVQTHVLMVVISTDGKETFFGRCLAQSITLATTKRK
jgi:hypothetical protein